MIHEVERKDLNVGVEVLLGVELWHQLPRVHPLLNIAISLKLASHCSCSLGHSLDASLHSLGAVQPPRHLSSGQSKIRISCSSVNLQVKGGSVSRSFFQLIIVW